MWRYVLRRLAEMVPTTFGVLMLSFILFYVVGGSPAQTVLGQHASQRAIAAFDAANGYDLPLFFGNWYAIDALRRAPGGGTELAFSLGPGRYELPGATRLTLQEAATGTLRTSSRWRLRPSVFGRGSERKRRVYSAGDSAFVAGRSDSADGVAGTAAAGGVPAGR